MAPIPECHVVMTMNNDRAEGERDPATLDNF